MIFDRLRKIIKKKSIDRRLKEAKIGLRDEVKELRKEINEIDKEIVKKFEEKTEDDRIMEIVIRIITHLYMFFNGVTKIIGVKITIDQMLEEMKIILKNEVEELKKKIDIIDRKIVKKFEEGIGADKIKKEIIALDIVGLYMEAEVKIKNFEWQYREYLTIEKYGNQLKEILSREIDNPGFLIDVGTLMNIDKENIWDRIYKIKKQLFDGWCAVEAGKINTEEVKEMLSVKIKLNNKIEELQREVKEIGKYLEMLSQNQKS